jgi:hypothetical protein
LFFSLTTVSTERCARMCVNSAAPAGGRSPGSSQRALACSARAAAIACSSRLAATATKLPSRTTASTPGIALAAAMSMFTSRARGASGRTTRPWTMPGSRMSCRYASPPVTLAGMSRRLTLWPTSLCSLLALGATLADASRWNEASPATSQ